MKEFDKQTLFLNIYYLWCLHHFFSMYYIWKSTALTRLEKNVKRKWVADLPNVNLFLERIREGDEKMTRKLCFFFDSGSYSEHFLLWKIAKEMELLHRRHLIKPKRHLHGNQ